MGDLYYFIIVVGCFDRGLSYLNNVFNWFHVFLVAQLHKNDAQENRIWIDVYSFEYSLACCYSIKLNKKVYDLGLFCRMLLCLFIRKSIVMNFYRWNQYTWLISVVCRFPSDSKWTLSSSMTMKIDMYTYIHDVFSFNCKTTELLLQVLKQST